MINAFKNENKLKLAKKKKKYEGNKFLAGYHEARLKNSLYNTQKAPQTSAKLGSQFPVIPVDVSLASWERGKPATKQCLLISPAPLSFLSSSAPS